jgi:UDP-N-acetylmuramoyl-tripeptide--D-alanyl-D-alanine ligase
MELIKLTGPIYLINDTYNSNPASARAALAVLTDLKGSGRSLAFLGDMLELGRTRRAEHKAVGRTAANLGLDLLAAVGPESKALAAEAAAGGVDTVLFRDAEEAARWAADKLRPNDRVLVKGSRGMQMERIVEFLSSLQKGKT